MTNDKLLESLRALGIDAQHLHLVALLPLVRVAWADGEVQDAERELIVGLAQRHGLLEGGGLDVIDGWLESEPSPFFVRTSFLVVAELHDRAALPDDLPADEVVGWCWALADAAGGLFGTRLMAIRGAEKEALEEVANALGVTEVPDWSSFEL